MEGPLAGIRVLDFGHAAVGPVSAEYMGELGADVIKVEPPTGDIVRAAGTRSGGVSATFLGNNINKRGVVLDLKDPDDHATALRLIATADVLIENFRSAEVMERLDLGYATLSAVNPRLIYVQSSAYGPGGPMSGLASHEWFAQASGGATSVTGVPNGGFEFSRGTASLDWNGAFVNVEAMLVGLYVRERTGRGMMIQTSQFQSALLSGTTRFAEYFASGSAPRPMGSARANIVPDQTFATDDGYVTVTVLHDGMWKRFCRAVWPELIEDGRFATNNLRVANRDVLIPLIEERFRQVTSAEWVQRLRACEVPVGEFQTGPNLSASLLDHPQIQAEHLVSILETPWGPMATAEPAWKFDKTEARITRAAPALGEHQLEVLAELNVGTRAN